MFLKVTKYFYIVQKTYAYIPKIGEQHKTNLIIILGHISFFWVIKNKHITFF